MIELVEYIVKELVEDKESVKINAKMDGDTEIISIKVAAGDTGKIIGKKGKIVSAIRIVAKAVGARKGKKYIVEVED